MRSSSSAEGLQACRRRHAALLAAALVVVFGSACARHAPPAAAPARPSRQVRALQSGLARIFGAPQLAHALFGAEVRSLQTGELLYALNPHGLVMPASNMKIVTMAAAAERLGWDHRFETTLVSSAPIEDGVLRGDLIVIGGGDPSINDRHDRGAKVFEEWADALEAAGIRAIDGRIVGDDDAFDDEGLGAGWAWDYLAYGYATPVGALQYRENLARLTLTPGAAEGDPVAVEIAPAECGIELVARVTTVARDGRLSLDFRRLPERSELHVTGTVPAGSEALTRTVSVDNPTAFFVRALRSALAARGIEVRGEAVDVDDLGGVRPPADRLRVLASSQSPPLAEIGAAMMKVSQNLYAETLLKAIGRSIPTGDGHDGAGSTASGRAAVRDVLEGWGVTPDAYIQYDGSGLSRYNYVTAGMLVTILRRMYDDPRHRDAFLATLPVAGTDGTIGSRMKGTRAEGNARAKTGTIANVRALSGYVTTRDGEPLVFSIVANHFHLPASTIDESVDRAVEALASFTRKK